MKIFLSPAPHFRKQAYFFPGLRICEIKTEAGLSLISFIRLNLKSDFTKKLDFHLHHFVRSLNLELHLHSIYPDKHWSWHGVKVGSGP